METFEDVIRHLVNKASFPDEAHRDAAHAILNDHFSVEDEPADDDAELAELHDEDVTTENAPVL